MSGIFLGQGFHGLMQRPFTMSCIVLDLWTVCQRNPVLLSFNRSAICLVAGFCQIIPVRLNQMLVFASLKGDPQIINALGLHTIWIPFWTRLEPSQPLLGQEKKYIFDEYVEYQRLKQTLSLRPNLKTRICDKEQLTHGKSCQFGEDLLLLVPSCIRGKKQEALIQLEDLIHPSD